MEPMDPTLLAGTISQWLVSEVLWLAVILMTALPTAFYWYRGEACLLFLQQEEYNGRRFLAWLWKTRAFDISATAVVAIIATRQEFFWSEDGSGILYLFALALMALGLGVWRSLRVLNRAKKKLVITARAKRILALYMVLCIVIVPSIHMANLAEFFGFFPYAIPQDLFGFFDLDFFLYFAIFLQLPPFLLVLANWLLSPLEKRTQAKYWREAKDKLGKLKPTVIAITGSYGKTSTKHILAHILSAAEATLATPGSVNTEMGIARIVREQLEARHKYFIVEMGAYGPGSIERLCKLAPPNLGLITSVGHAHYERFKSLETVAEAKFELARAVTENGGKTIINTVAIPEDLLTAQLQRASEVILAGEAGQPFDMRITCREVAETRDGLSVRLNVMDAGGVAREVSFLAPIYGTQQAGNIMLAVAAAMELGYPVETIQAALKTLPQIRHRLEVTLADTGPSVIDDAYNSNPTGFRAALETLNVLGVPGGRRVLITPGMVELGEAHNEQHEEIGRIAGRCVDLALIVGPERISSLIEGFEETKGEKAEIRTFAKQQEAEAWYKANAQDFDVVLFENNLPDIYEAKVRF